jgi:hypothetical protein
MKSERLKAKAKQVMIDKGNMLKKKKKIELTKRVHGAAFPQRRRRRR